MSVTKTNRLGAKCIDITIYDREQRDCEEMRDYLGIAADRMYDNVSRDQDFVADLAQHGQFDQVLLLDVIEHILDDGAALRKIYRLKADDGFIYITTRDRDWQGIVSGLRVTRCERRHGMIAMATRSGNRGTTDQIWDLNPWIAMVCRLLDRSDGHQRIFRSPVTCNVLFLGSTS